MSSSIYELIVTDECVPFDVSLHSVNYVPSHWHNSMEIIFVLRGNLEASVGSLKYSLSEGDVLLINHSLVHEVIGLDLNIIATFQIPLNYMKANLAGGEHIQFDCHAGTAPPEKKSALDQIRQLLAEMVHLTYKKGEAYELEMQSRMLGVLSVLVKQFKSSVTAGGANEKYMERMLRIITYIEDHYKEPVTLQSIAEREFLSVPYLSKFFSEHMGLNFQNYLTSIRLKNAVEELLRHEELPIAELSENHGFPNVKSFYAAFKNRYHITPNEYRKQYRPDLREGKQERPSSNYLTFNQSSALGIINQYLQRRVTYHEEHLHSIQLVRRSIEVGGAGDPLRHTWRNVITIGKAQEGLLGDIQEQLRYVQRTVPFRYLRFHGIFDDGMSVYREDSSGQPVLSFRLTDQLFDFLLSIGLKPFIELGFMPSAMAADPDKTVFYRKSYTSPPASLDRWCGMVDAFIRHNMNRYGAAEVESWMFEFWNEPEFPIFWPSTLDEFNEMYARTYETVKTISPRLQIGGPGRIITIHSNELNERFFAFCRERDCIPDFVPVHFYPHEGMDQIVESDELDVPLAYRKLLEEFKGISANPDFLRDMLIREQQLLQDLGLSQLPLYLTEWNSTAYHRDLTNDTLYKAAYIVKNIVENLDRIESFGYWVLSDNHEEYPAAAELFHGGLGLLTQYGIPKPGMYAFQLLSRLGSTRIAREEGSIVTAGNGGYQIMTYNYAHFDDLYAMGDTSFIHATNRYNGFKEEKTLRQEIELKGIPEGLYQVVTHTIDRLHGSSYDKWVEMGAPSVLRTEDLSYLQDSSVPRRHVQQLEIQDSWTCVSVLEPHAVQLVEIIPVL
ncbi:helix-turn-helix domain-containing protein [Paenibacillus sp. JX-17]|uniref:Helix-turn-helix domain-containing protein n=1 Tax=Paenibacillus lacisoli TaxID=3064525 RepID=A0ABT9CG17_9BACL|nr:helix-turn-helix domain-containing protein [Paenibacillus sp. JX-17]MDO7908190.1 helix-turn-helix domain-containing protein [Paenibacillus sp. JX-17]